jgi:hypothetical protein
VSDNINFISLSQMFNMIQVMRYSSVTLFHIERLCLKGDVQTMKKLAFTIYILMCISLVACSSSKVDKNKQIIHHESNIMKSFDEQDYKRMKQFVDRFNDKKGDYILAIPPIIDGGYTIYDLYSDGNRVTIKIDGTRDIYGGREYKYVCGAMKIENNGEEQVVVMNKCEGLEEGATVVRLFTFIGELARMTN